MNSRKKDPTRGNLTKDQIKQLTDIALKLAIAEAKYKSISRIIDEYYAVYDDIVDPMFIHDGGQDSLYNIMEKTTKLHEDNRDEALKEYTKILKSYQQTSALFGIKNSKKIYNTAKINNVLKGDTYYVSDFPAPHGSQHEDTIDQDRFIKEFKSELHQTRHVSFIIDKPAPKAPRVLTYADMVKRQP